MRCFGNFLVKNSVALEENPYVFCVLDVDFIFKFDYSLQ